MKTQSGKVLVGIFIGCAILAAIGCWYDNHHPRLNTFYRDMAHVEIHIDRPIEDISREVERDNESDYDRIDREITERNGENDFDRMS